MDFAIARQNMIDGQLRPNKVTDAALLAAMGEVPREAFLPEGRRALAYVDEDVAVAPGRWLIEPMVFARLVQAAEVTPGSRVLLVGAGAGYGAAVIARIGARVVALEVPGTLADTILARAPGVVVARGELAAGWAEAAPYDVILIEGAVETLPAAYAGQLAEGGRLVTVLASGRPGVLGRAVRQVKVGGSLTEIPLFEAGTPCLPEFRRTAEFVF